MNVKLIVIGGIVFFVVQWLLSFVTGPVIHNNILMESYQATAGFWRPALMAQPPDMAALLPRWITTGLINALIVAGVYSVVRGSFAGSGLQRGLKYGVAIALLSIGQGWSYSGFFNLPDKIWTWWSVDMVIGAVVASAVMGWVAEKVAPTGASA